MKDEELAKLKEFLEKASSFELPSYDHLPSVPLYMEQVISYVNSILAPLSNDDKQLLTSFMVNNYVKAKIIAEPTKKKYNVDHLGYLLAISLLKNVLNMSDISLIIGMDKEVTTDKVVLYRFFRTMSSDIFKDVGGRTKTRIDRFVDTYEKQKEEDPNKAEKHLDDSIGLIALRMSIQATAYQIISQALFGYLKNAEINSEKVENSKKAKGEIRRERKEAKKAERRASRENKKEETVKENKE